MRPVLLAGETFVTTSLVAAGSEVSVSSGYTNGATRFKAALATAGIETIQLGSERCEAEFPKTTDQLGKYSVVVISDVGALSLLVTPETRQGLPGVNRLEVLRSWVEGGGGLMMAGGYTSFQGMHGTARYCGTPLEDGLPVRCLPHSDGLEAPEGLVATIAGSSHPILEQLPASWPPMLGMNKVVAASSADTEVLATVQYRGVAHPLLVARSYGLGRSLAWTTDIGTHWLSRPFLNWQGYDTLMSRMMRWLAREI